MTKRAEELSGLELREAVAIEVMGARLPVIGWCHSAGGYACSDADKYKGSELLDGSLREIPAYESTWEGAGLVVEKMRERGWHIMLDNVSPDFGWEAEMQNGSDEHYFGLASNAPLAICRAALAAIRASK